MKGLGKKILISAIAMGVVASTAMTANAANWYTCEHEISVDRGTYYVGTSYFNPDCHKIEYETEYFCEECERLWYVSYYDLEAHDYRIDYDMDMLICDECGDTYEWH